MVWKRLDRNSDVTAIVAELDQEYRVRVDTLARDVDTLLADLRSHGLVAPVE